MERRLLLLNSVLLRQNPHNVAEWHKRVKLYEGQPHEVKGYRNFIKMDEYLFTIKSNVDAIFFCR